MSRIYPSPHSYSEHPDQAWERQQEQLDDIYLRELAREDRLRHALDDPYERAPQRRRVTTTTKPTGAL